MRFLRIPINRGKLPSGVWAIAALPVVWFAFGSAFVGLKVGVATLPPFLFSGSRFLLVGTLLIAWSTWRTGGRLELSRREALVAGSAGAGLILAGQGSASWASQYMAPGMVAVLGSTMPLWAALIGWITLGTRLALQGMIGLVAGFAGVVFLAWPSSGAGVPLIPALVTTAGAIGWAAGALIASRAGPGRRPALMTGLQMLTGGSLQLLVGLFSGEAPRLALHPLLPAVPVFVYLVVVPGLIGFPLFIWLLTTVPVHVANTVAYAAPVVALALGWILLGEQVTARTLGGVGVILAGVAMIVTSARRAPTRRPQEASAEEQTAA